MANPVWIIWDPRGVLEDVTFDSEKVAVMAKINLEKAWERPLRIRKVFPERVEQLDLFKNEATNFREGRIVALQERIKHIDHEIGVMQDRKGIMEHELSELLKGRTKNE